MDKIKNLSPEQRRRVVARTALKLSESVKGLESSVRVLITAASDNNFLSLDQIAELRSYAEAADDRYLTLQEQDASESKWTEWFAKARLATGLADIFFDASANKTSEAMYELCFVIDDKVAVAAFESEIQSLKKVSEYCLKM